MYQGIIKSWKQDKGYGFIKTGAAEQDIFIHKCLAESKLVLRAKTSADFIDSLLKFGRRKRLEWQPLVFH
ncbi:cold shock domain-containing protein, partial [Methylomicrobium sp. Wu6]|uniref:cold-shock protein n=1 Tax=Methylomicrobium sp. Wu6 TaxID=3107928 RepID=UPI002DD683ED